MILTTTEFIPDCEITKIINIVSGNNILDLKTIKLDIRGENMHKKVHLLKKFAQLY